MYLTKRLLTRQNSRVIPSIRHCGLSTLPVNEPLTDFTDPEVRKQLVEELQKIENEETEIPCVVGGERIYTGKLRHQVTPYRHQKRIAKIHMADENFIRRSIDSALACREEWENTSQDQRSAIFTKAADLLTTKHRYSILAATMAGQAKTAVQADIDCVAELADFLRFNSHYAKGIVGHIELIQREDIKNSVMARGLEGFIAAISPFNFTAIGGNLATGPAIVGNVVLWKPALTATRAAWLFFQILEEAGVPKGIINFLPCRGSTFGSIVTSSPHLAGITFVGSGGNFKTLWKQVGANIDNFKTFPRLSGECGGKNFHFLHESGNVDHFVNGTIRSAFEYSGQKCSACGRVYVPDTLWPEVGRNVLILRQLTDMYKRYVDNKAEAEDFHHVIKEKLIEKHKDIKLGEPSEFSTFLSAVINDQAYRSIKEFIDFAKESENVTVLAGGKCDDSVGYYIEPTIVETKDPHDKLMEEEIFGPVLPIYVYPAKRYKETLKLINETSPYGLTGAVYSEDRSVVDEAKVVLRQAAGNMYINDQSTGSVVAQQPFGGSRASGTNDKPGSYLNILPWISPLTVKENSLPLEDWKYKYME